MVFIHKNIRLPAPRYRGTQWHFVTMCCADRRREFAAPGRASWIVDELRQQADTHRFAVHAYCAMPDHLHALAMGTEAASDLLRFVKSLKQRTGYEFRKTFRRDLWQKKFYDHILRRADSIDRVAGYIWMNPVRQGICGDPREYLYSGSFTIDWTKGMAPIGEWAPPWKGNPLAKAERERQKQNPPT